MIVRIYITLKKGVLDPQGKIVHKALNSLGYDEVEGVRLGKFIIMRLKDKEPEVARVRIEQMCQRLLANPVIEDYSFKIIDDEEAGCAAGS